MNFKLQFFLLMLCIVISCEKDTPLEFVSHNNSESDIVICTTFSCPEVSVSYIQVIGDIDIANKINSSINNHIISSLYLGDGEKDPKAITIIDAIENFIKMYRTHSAEFPDMAAEYFADVSVSKTYFSKEIISLELREYLFTGGAHGYGSVEFMNLDPTTGEIISTEALFKNVNEFIPYAERKFREEHSIPQTSNINSTGFWFKNDTFSLPTTIGLTSENIILRYNQYEIDSYAAGPVELEISREEAQQFLNYK